MARAAVLWAAALTAGSEARDLHAAFLFSGDISDYGWSFTHNLGRMEAQRQMMASRSDPSDVIKTSLHETVAPGDAARLIGHLVKNESADVVFATSFMFHDQMFAAAKEYPEAAFVHVSGYYGGVPNFATVHGRIYQGRYISGFTAGGATRRKRIGFIASVPIPEVYRSINAYYLGAQAGAGAAINATAVEHKVDVVVRWIGTFYDPVRERAAARELDLLGCDVIAYHTDSTAPPLYAKAHGMYSVGSNADMRQSVGESVLTSANYNWGPLYLEMMNRTYHGTFRDDTADRALFYGYSKAAVTNSPASFEVPEPHVARIDGEKARLHAGWDPFCHPVLKGGEVMNTPVGGCVSDLHLLTAMVYVVDGVHEAGWHKHPGEVCGNGTSYVVNVTHTPPRIETVCTPCPVGRYFASADVQREAGCAACPAGTIAAEPGASACVPCPEGQYAALPGQSTCVACPDGKTTVGEGNSECLVDVEGVAVLLVALLSVAGFVILVSIPVVVCKMRHDKKAMEELVSEADVAQKCAKAIARMQLEELDWIQQIPNPSEIIESFGLIVDTLREYRRFLPESLLKERAFSHVDMCLVPAPGTDGEPVTIVFTDIEGSTKLWEDAPGAMSVALQLHDAVVREVIFRTGGYEVKTLGDSFMIAFGSLADAVTFAADLQAKLFDAAWPQEVLQCNGCEPVQNLWRGLRVRVAMVQGTARAERNQLTDRFDYHGPMVNKAARIEAAGVGGAVIMTAEDAKVLGQEHPELHAQLVILSMGERELRGIGTVEAVLALPQRFAGRMDDCRRKAKLRVQQVQSNPLGTKRRTSSVAYATNDLPDLRLEHRKAATLAVSRVETAYTPPSAQGAAYALSAMLLLAERAQGSLVSIFNEVLVCGWGVCIPQSQHLDFAVQFTRSIDNLRFTPRCSEAVITTAVCSGPVYTGVVGTQRQRIVTALTPMTKYCTLLLEVAADLGCASLVSAMPGQPTVTDDRGLKKRSRPVAVARFPAKSSVEGKDQIGDDAFVEVGVYQVRPGATQDSMQREESAFGEFVSDMSGDDTTPWGWGEEYWTAFSRGAHEAMAANAGEDPVLQRVAAYLAECGAHRRIEWEAVYDPAALSPAVDAQSVRSGRRSLSVLSLNDSAAV
eukprot:TRINITY_DN3130_c0_g1_i1.p1 TRINITY_DN3130_c0_g1~~TRINITY_DN3130_c0_g1_i1.p1  ORF type:complete len:1149 (+),score=316.89 TRINITY_DN3130_c0_g1_i1:59-3448(+)